jgi:hypothetical protein
MTLPPMASPRAPPRAAGEDSFPPSYGTRSLIPPRSPRAVMRQSKIVRQKETALRDGPAFTTKVYEPVKTVCTK